MSVTRAPVPAPIEHRGRRPSVALYLTVVAALVVPANVVAADLGADAQHPDQGSGLVQLALYGQAVIPAVAALLAWAVARTRPTWGFRRASWRSLGAAWLVGVLAVALSYAGVWLSGAGRFAAAGWSGTWGGLPSMLVVPTGLVMGVLPWMALAVGEELGWNSFLAPRLAARLRADRTALAVGGLWAAFHLPLILLVPGAVPVGVPTLWTAAWFVVECVALAYPLVWLRLRTGSLWPALVLHGSFNAALYLVAEPATRATASTGWFSDEGGLLTSVGTVLAVILTRRLWRVGSDSVGQGRRRPCTRRARRA
ncbi:CPBP family intramembrane glutamic endopeptidase [uncultured Friedmanniella sp.]|uniref:CPBP family intramembrane glutamic endopeptidase n=1 Tax=uncultured Friedmanniella sp. TaxID=335381 RepID=UPI0035C9CEDE